MKPQGNLGELDRHGILVDAVDNTLQDHAAHDVPVVELGGVDGPAL
ncbi:MAG: hypothetical protein GZ089_03305 [Aromatoleum sp.]|nr:hypothetical protein [Aromatoleum sp.]